MHPHAFMIMYVLLSFSLLHSKQTQKLGPSFCRCVGDGVQFSCFLTAHFVQAMRGVIVGVLLAVAANAAFPSLAGDWRYRSFFNLAAFNVTNDQVHCFLVAAPNSLATQIVFAKGDFHFAVTYDSVFAALS